MTPDVRQGLDALAHLDSPDALRDIRVLRDSLRHPTAGLRETAAAMPTSVAALSNELALALSELARALHLHSPVMPRDIQELTPFVRAHWRRTQLWCGDNAWALAATDAELAGIVAGPPLAAAKVAPVLERLAKAEEPRLRHVVLRHFATCIADLSLRPVEALPLLIALSQDDDDDIRAQSVELLAASWLFSLSGGAARRRLKAIETALEDDVAEVVCAALNSAAALGASQLILRRFADADASTAIRKRALKHLESVGEEEHIAAMLRLAKTDPLAYASTARDSLLGMHRRGVFVRAEHLPALLELYDSRDDFSGDELVRLSHLVRRELIELLRGLPASDLRWVRRADILARSFGTGAHLLLGELLQKSEEGRVAGALLDAAAASAEFDACDAALPLYDAMPERVLTLLRAKGDDAHSAMLLQRVCHPSCPRALRAQLVEVLWTLSSDRNEVLRTLSTELGPRESGLLRRAKGSQNRSVAKLVAEAPWSEQDSYQLKASERLKIYAASGDTERREQLVAEFRTAYRQCLAKALNGDFSANASSFRNLSKSFSSTDVTSRARGEEYDAGTIPLQRRGATSPFR